MFVDDSSHSLDRHVALRRLLIVDAIHVVNTFVALAAMPLWVSQQFGSGSRVVYALVGVTNPAAGCVVSIYWQAAFEKRTPTNSRLLVGGHGCLIPLLVQGTYVCSIPSS